MVGLFETTQRIIEMAGVVFDTLGPGYSERVYHNAMEVCLRNENIAYETERIVPITFQNHVIGNIRADLIVEKSIVVELKAVSCINNTFRNQTRAYLNMTGYTTAIILNFQQSDKTNQLQHEIINSVEIV